MRLIRCLLAVFALFMAGLAAPARAGGPLTSGQTLAGSGVYTIEISDNGLNDAGAYAMTFLNLTAGPLTGGADLDGGPIASAEVRNGTSVVGDFDAFTFTGTLNDRVLINLPATAGAAGENIRQKVVRVLQARAILGVRLAAGPPFLSLSSGDDPWLQSVCA